MPEFTQEQIDQMLVDARKGYIAPEDYQKELQREVDRRVETGIQKGMETQSEKIRREAEERAKLSAEDIAKRELSDKEQILVKREKEILRKANELDAKDMLSSAQIPKEQYTKLLSVLISENEEITKVNVQNFIDVYATTKNDVETRVKSEFSRVTPPTTGGTDVTTKADFNKMSYSQKLELKQNKPELYKEFMN